MKVLKTRSLQKIWRKMYKLRLSEKIDNFAAHNFLIEPLVMAKAKEKTRYTDKELKEFDALLDAKLEKARSQLAFYTSQLEERAENPDSKIRGLDDGVGSVESERLTNLAVRQKNLIQHLENAKIRIKNKVYGVCRVTGKLISKERLKAVPHATLSIEAKQRR